LQTPAAQDIGDTARDIAAVTGSAVGLFAKAEKSGSALHRRKQSTRSGRHWPAREADAAGNLDARERALADVQSAIDP
jgi:hypothetical protein